MKCADPVVSISTGKIKGTQKTVQGVKLNVFYNVPYAEPPIGDNRFRKPIPLTKKSDEVYKAVRNSRVCYSMPAKYLDIKSPFKVNETEDCLTLNIWSPADLSSDQLKPVLVYIHGGAFIIDGARDPRISDGELLSTLGDFVVVLVRYRLGVFGCLFTNSDEAPGNLPLEDQALALEWISDNIKYFGGDPERITLSGESAGSISVALHFLRQRNRPLFKQMILQSGATRTNLNEDIGAALMRSAKISKFLGCSPDESINHLSSPEILSCLRSATPERLMEAYMSEETEPSSIHGAPTCLVNTGEFSQVDADRRLLSGSFPSGFPILVTTMVDEGSVIAVHTRYDKSKGFREGLLTILNHLHSSEAANVIDETYFSGLLDNLSEFDAEKAMVRALGDLFIRCPSIWFAEKTMDTNTVYTLEYTYASPIFSSMEPQLIFNSNFGPRHALDLVYVFATPLLLKKKVTEEDITQTEQIISIWKQFIHNGKLDWSPYIRQSHTGKILPHQLEVNPTKQINSTKFDERFFHCEIWKKLIYGNNF